MQISLPAKLVTAASAALTGLLVPVGAMAGSIGAFSVRPAHFNPAAPLTRAFFVPTITRGGSFSDQVVVTNGGPRPITLRVDAVDGVTGVTSGAVYANRQVRKRGAARWVHPAAKLVHVPAHGHVAVAFVVRVPAPARAGDHLAGLAFEDAHPRRRSGKFSVTEIVRTVVGVDIHVGGRALPHVKLYNVGLMPLPGTAFRRW